MSSARILIAASASALLAPILAVPLAGPVLAGGRHESGHPLASSIAVSWQRTAIRTIYTDAKKPPPEGALYLAFTSLAVHDAAVEGKRHGRNAAAAAVATAAHDVLAHYFPASGAALKADLDASLAMVPDGRKEAAGVVIGASAAASMIASRVDDGRNDASVVYSRAAAPGVWQPAAGAVMTVAWLGFVTPVVDVEPVELDGPDPLTSEEYARDYEEVRTIGEVNSVRSDEQTAVAKFFSANPIPMYRTAVCNLLQDEPMGLLPTTRLFARIDAAVANTFIQTWQRKYDFGYWRPYQAIAGAASDGNDATQPHPGPLPWTPLITNPSYPEYTTGHGSATSPFAQVMRWTFGDRVPLVLTNPDSGVSRPYTRLSALEDDAFNARIWGGLHFRDAMEDGYRAGHRTANRVFWAIR